jgi:hypothetical protein
MKGLPRYNKLNQHREEDIVETHTRQLMPPKSFLLVAGLFEHLFGLLCQCLHTGSLPRMTFEGPGPHMLVVLLRFEPFRVVWGIGVGCSAWRTVSKAIPLLEWVTYLVQYDVGPQGE